MKIRKRFDFTTLKLSSVQEGWPLGLEERVSWGSASKPPQPPAQASFHDGVHERYFVDKLKAKLIAGRIIPAIATATACAT
eukprot:1085257-Pelagomonas_calceolata.AAC.4